MPRHLRFLNDTSTSSTDLETPDSDFIVVLAALLCGLICTLGLIAVARCAFLRRIATIRNQQPSQSIANKGLTKKVIRVLPKHTFTSSDQSASAECPICLAEFVDGDELRALPLCGHRFHALCVDTWLQSHSSCPSCRRILTVERCEHCGKFAADGSSSGSCEGTGDGGKGRRVSHEHDDNRFLP